MNSLEDQLAEALARKGASVAPATVPFDDVVVRAHRRVRRRRAAGALGVAAAVLAGGVAWSAARTDHAQVVVVDDPAITTEDSLPAAAGSWTVLPEAPLSARRTPSVVWTGSEFIVWGGIDASGFVLADGAAYDPAAGSWRSITPNSWGHPGARAVWDGEEMIVAAKAGGAAYDPVTDSWRELPSIDLGVTEGVGISQLVMAGDDVIAVGFGSDDAPTIVMWRLQDSGWEEFGATDAVGGVGWRAIGRPDGVVKWNVGDGAPVEFRFDGAWSVHQPPVLPDGASLAGDVELVWAGGAVRAIVPLLLDGGDRNATMIATLDGYTWTEPGQTIEPTFGLTQTVAFGDDAVVLGGRFDGGKDPLLLDGETGTVQFLADYPLDTTIDHGLAASDDQLFVWGGQRPSDGEQSTDSSPVSATGALWTRSAPSAEPSASVTDATAGFGGGRVTSDPGQVLDLTSLDPQRAESPDRYRELPELSVIQSASLSLDDRFTIADSNGSISIVRPDGTIDDQLTVPPDSGRSLAGAAIGPLEVLYISESSIDASTSAERLRFTAVPTTGVTRGQRVRSAMATDSCDACRLLRFGPDRLLSADLTYVVPEGDGGPPILPRPPSLTGTVTAQGPADSEPSSYEWVVQQMTVTMPDRPTQSWDIRIPHAQIAAGTAGQWHTQSDGGLVGIIPTVDGVHYLVDLKADGSSTGRVLFSFLSDVYAAFHDESGISLVTFSAESSRAARVDHYGA